MGRFFVKKKKYEDLVGELQILQENYNELKIKYEKNLYYSNELALINNSLLKTNENKDKRIDCLIKENTKLYNKIADFKIDVFSAIQVNIKSTKKLRIRNKQKKKLENDVIQHLVNLALEK